MNEYDELTEKEYESLSEEDILNELDINIDSLYSLEKSLKRQSKISGKYSRWLALAIKEVDTLKLALEIITAEIIDETCREYKTREGKEFPLSYRAELRKNLVPLDERYQRKMKELIEATEKANTLKGFVYAFAGRSRNLKSIAEMMKDITYNQNPRIMENKISNAGNKLNLE
jgi:hypothetical protein